MARNREPISPAERAALIAREQLLSVRCVVNLFRLLRERRGVLTLAQIRRMSGLLADRAEELYHRADRGERGDAAARLPRTLSLAALARRVGQVGQVDDPVTQTTTVRLGEIAATLVQHRPGSRQSHRSPGMRIVQGLRK